MMLPEYPLNAAGFDGRVMILEPLENSTELALFVYETKSGRYRRHASAHWRILRRNSHAERSFTETMQVRESGLEIASYVAFAARDSDFPHYLDASTTMNLDWSAKILR